MKKVLLGLLLISLFFGGAVTFAQDSVQLDNPLEADTLLGFINIVLNIIWYLTVVIAPLTIVIAGFIYLTSEGKPEKVKQANSLIMYSLIGLAIVFISKAIVNLFLKGLGVNTGF